MYILLYTFRNGCAVDIDNSNEYALRQRAKTITNSHDDLKTASEMGAKSRSLKTVLAVHTICTPTCDLFAVSMQDMIHNEKARNQLITVDGFGLLSSVNVRVCVCVIFFICILENARK